MTVLINTVADESMAESVRSLIMAIEVPGRTYGSVLAHCEMSGVDTSHWPQWFRDEHPKSHFTKAAVANLLWHCMSYSYNKRKKDEHVQ